MWLTETGRRLNTIFALLRGPCRYEAKVSRKKRNFVLQKGVAWLASPFFAIYKNNGHLSS